MRLGRTTVVYLGSQVGASVAGFLATFYIARFFGAELLGTYSIVVAALFWMGVPANALSTALTKRMSEGTAPGRYLSAGVLLTAAAGILVAGIVLLAAPLVDTYVGAAVALPLAALLVANFLFIIMRAALQGGKRVGRSGVVEAFERILRTGFQIGLLVLGFGLLGLLVGHAVAMFAAAAVAFVLLPVRPRLPRIGEVRRLLSFARYAWLGTIQTVAFAWMDTAILAVFSTHARIGIYEASWTLGSALMLAAFSIRQTLFPELSDLTERGELDMVRHYLNEGIVYLGVIAIPALFGALAVGDRVLRIYRPEFSEGASVLVALILAQLLAGYATQFVSAINAIDRPEIAYRINGAFIAANLVLNLMLIPLFDWYGAAVATALSAAVALGFGYSALRQLIGFTDVPYAELGREVAASLVMAAVVFWIAGVAPTGNYVTIAIVLFGAGVYGVILLAISTRIRRKAMALVRSVTVS